MKRTVFYLLLVSLVLYCSGPFLWQLITSLKPDVELTKIPPIFPEHPTAMHYISIFEGHPFFRIILNSAVVASSTTLLSLIIGSLAAFGLAKLGIRYKALILGFVLSVSMFPPIATVSPLYIIIGARILYNRDPGIHILMERVSLCPDIHIHTGIKDDTRRDRIIPRTSWNPLGGYSRRIDRSDRSSDTTCLFIPQEDY